MNNSIFGYLQLIRYQKLIWALLTYSIGVGLAQHNGAELDWVNILLGALLALFLIIMRDFLSAYFDHPASLSSTLQKDDLRYEQMSMLERSTLLVISLTILTAGALATVLLMIRQLLSLSSLIIIGIAFLISYFLVVPPVQLDKRGYGEFSEAILICNLIPAIGLLLSESELHVLLLMLTLPLTLLYIAFQIVLGLESYAFARAHQIQSLVTRLDWQKAMSLHNYLILLAFFFVGLFALLGQPWSLTWPMFLPLMIGVYQIVQIFGILSGKPPRWKLLKLTAGGSFIIMAYLISFTLWIS